MKLMILDGNSVINRAFYGIRPLTTRDGLLDECDFWLSEYPAPGRGGGVAGCALRRL